MRRVIAVAVALGVLVVIAGVVWTTLRGASTASPYQDAPQPAMPEATPPAPSRRPVPAAAKALALTLDGVSPVTGQSWVAHLKEDVGTTPLGHQGGDGSAPASAATREPAGGPFLLTGADLYRIDCQGCHGPEGKGAPPAINALIGPVEATRPELMKKRLAKGGHTLPDALLKQMAAQARAIIVKRLHDGGKHMPPFAHLNAAEVDALIDYLKRLVAPVSRMPVTLAEPPARVGEHLVKGTCHTCHDATGPGGHAVALAGKVPSLASFAGDFDPKAIVAKVRDGLPAGPVEKIPAGGWKMPRFPYLTDAELAAAVTYLKQHPPKP